MLDDKKDDIFLSRWINNELSPEELAAFESHPEYEYYKKIKLGSAALDLTEYDLDKALENIKSTKTNKTNKTNKPVINLWPTIAVAASIAIIFGIFLFNTDDTFSTSYGEQLAVTLPDGSEMILNAKSEASFNKKEWKTNRSVQINGEAYFKVKKGSKFTVNSTNGSVTVLGTQFTVQSTNNFFEAICYEGKVSIESNNDQAILTAGKAFRTIKNTTSKNWNLKHTEPSWIHKISTFKSTPVEYVLNELEEQYNIRINRKNINANAIFSGTFPNNNKEVALKTVFSTLGMKFAISSDGTSVVVEK